MKTLLLATFFEENVMREMNRWMCLVVVLVVVLLAGCTSQAEKNRQRQLVDDNARSLNALFGPPPPPQNVRIVD